MLKSKVCNLHCRLKMPRHDGKKKDDDECWRAKFENGLCGHWHAREMITEEVKNK